MAGNTRTQVISEATVETPVMPATTAVVVPNINEAEARRKKLLAFYKAEPKKQLYMSPMYRPYVGNVMRVMINGISIYFPVDGASHEVPATFADIIEERRKAIDAIILRKNNMANVTGNFEATPGELPLV